ncbi:BA3454 family stress response protein [Bacillus salipaludis]|nr:BA3454 family stress response protein [Bacillus salipaludis]
MMQVNVTVTYQGKNYLTNVITNRDMSEEEIFQLAYQQVQKQYERKNL